MLIDTFTTYSDEFGEIDAEVLRAAQKIWHYCRILALKSLNDEQKGQMLLMQAAALVTKKVREKNSTIHDLPSYLFQTFRHLVFAEARKQSRHQELEEKYFESLGEFFQNDAHSEEAKICRRILIEEIEAKMDEWTKKVYRYLEAGYKYKDLVPKYGSAENVIRARFSGNLKKLAKIIQEK